MVTHSQDTEKTQTFPLRVIVTGGSRGIGRAVAEYFVKLNANVTILGRDQVALDDACASLNAKYQREVHSYQIDLSCPDQIQSFFKAYQKASKQLDVLVNCAGQMPLGIFGMTKPSVIEECFQINVFAAMQCTQFALRLMARQKSGVVINLSSVVAKQGATGQSVYAASKAAIEAFTKSVAREVAAQGIRVNCVAPGMVDTDLLKALQESQIEKALMNASIDRIANVEEITEVIGFIASDKASYINGQVIAVDGGMQL